MAFVCSISHTVASAGVITIGTAAELSIGIYNYTSRASSNGYAGNVVQENIGSSTEIWHFYERFNLPDYEPDTVLTSAILSYTITNRRSAHELAVFGTSGDWTTFNWYNKPVTQSGILGRLTMASGTSVVQIDITDYLKSFYSGAVSAGFMVRSMYEGSIWNDLAYFSGQSLSLTFTPNVPSEGEDPHDVPEPNSTFIFASGLALLGCAAYLRRRKPGCWELGSNGTEEKGMSRQAHPLL